MPACSRFGAHLLHALVYAIFRLSGDADARRHRGLRALDRHGDRCERTHVRASQRRAPHGQVAPGGGRRGPQTRVSVDLLLEPRHDRDRGDPLLLRHRHGQGLRVHARHRSRGELLHRGRRDADAAARSHRVLSPSPPIALRGRRAHVDTPEAACPSGSARNGSFARRAQVVVLPVVRALIVPGASSSRSVA